MVRVVNNSCYGYGYLENNRQLARKVSELEQQLGAAIQEIQNLREISHRKEVRIVDLETTVNELKGYKAKHEAIKQIILGTRPVESIQASNTIHQTTSIHALTDSNCETGPTSPLRLPSVSHAESNEAENYEHEDDEDEDVEEKEHEQEDDDSQPGSPTSEMSESTLSANDSERQESLTAAEEAHEDSYEQDNSGRLTANVLQPIIEGSEEEDDDDNDAHNGTANTSLPSPSPTRTITRMDDSLEPANVTSVPSINHHERTMHTPSIWNCLDPLDAAQPPSIQKLLDQEQRSQQQTPPSQSPARSVASSISVGLRLSQSVNASSPIHPITRKVDPKLNDDVFHSTPAKRGRPAKGAKKKPPVKRAVKFTEEDDQGGDKEEEAPPAAPPTRYNLRKRARR